MTFNFQPNDQVIGADYLRSAGGQICTKMMSQKERVYAAKYVCGDYLVVVNGGDLERGQSRPPAADGKTWNVGRLSIAGGQRFAYDDRREGPDVARS